MRVFGHTDRRNQCRIPTRIRPCSRRQAAFKSIPPNIELGTSDTSDYALGGGALPDARWRAPCGRTTPDNPKRRTANRVRLAWPTGEHTGRSPHRKLLSTGSDQPMLTSRAARAQDPAPMSAHSPCEAIQAAPPRPAYCRGRSKRRRCPQAHPCPARTHEHPRWQAQLTTPQPGAGAQVRCFGQALRRSWPCIPAQGVAPHGRPQHAARAPRCDS